MCAIIAEVTCHTCIIVQYNKGCLQICKNSVPLAHIKNLPSGTMWVIGSQLPDYSEQNSQLGLNDIC